MHLKHLKISNYKSFYEPTEFSFEPGFNVLLGANSSGKSSVLEAISFQGFPNTPHRSILNSNEPDVVVAGTSATENSFCISPDEFTKLAAPIPHFYLGLGEKLDRFYSQDTNAINQRLVADPLHLDVKVDHSTGQQSRLSFHNWPSMWRQGANSPFPAALIQNTTCAQITNVSADTTDLVPALQKISQKTYRFSSERRVQASCAHYSDGELLPDCSNLAYCINFLGFDNDNLFAHLNKLLHRVFPTIYRVGAPPNGQRGQQLFELKIHMTLSGLNRGDLAVPINQVGTGVGNALAMLYVALTAQTQRFILLEEPNSFLHPRALRELLAILAEIGGKHQFFVTTHSSDVLRTIYASTVTLLEYDGQQTTIKQTTGKKLHELKAGLIDLGISLTDLHGCDKVIWVEGETEEAIFPTLLRHYFPELAQGIAVLPLHATGDFESKKYEPKKVAEIYKRLSEGSFLAPPMVAIALDRERRKDSEIEQIKKDCNGIVHFLPKIMLEDYMLDAEAIAAVLSQESNNSVTTEQVAAALNDAETSVQCLLNPANPTSKQLHAAKVLKIVFNQLATLEYHKTAHGPQIVDWMLVNKADSLLPLKCWLGGILKGA